ncbi:MAG: C4-dicarboxylate ABC transporter substrate-binding protein [Alphaproteobacteria bacterium]|nr:C4-dicarboxylate ABC transporter substrate-binding protein [Alphaproteobacteria bacterium]
MEFLTRPATEVGGILALALSLILGPAAIAEAQEKIAWRIAIYGPPRAVTKGIEFMAKHVEEKTAGKFTLRLHYNEQLSDAKDHLDGIKVDSFQGSLTAFGYSPGKAPLNSVIDLPYLPMKGIDAIARVMEDFYQFPPAKEELDRWNAYAIVGVPLPLYEFMGTGKPPRTLDDWKGMRVRAVGGSGEAMKTLGAIPTSVPAPEVYAALERNVFQAASFPFSYTFGSYKLHEVSKWYTFGLQLGTIHNAFTLSHTAFQKLPAEYRQLMIDVKAQYYIALREAYESEDRKWIPIFEKVGLERITITPDMLVQFQEKAAKPVWDKWIAEMEQKGLPGRKTFDFVFAAGTKYSKGS